MKIPFVTEAVVDMIIRAMGAGGYLPNVNDQNSIKTVSSALTEAQRDDLAISFSYGGGGGGSGSGLSSPTDIWILVDNDNTNPTTPYTNYVYMAKGQTGTPVTDPNRILFSLGSQSSPNAEVTCAIGPRMDQVSGADDVPATLTLGGGGNGMNNFVYGTISATKNYLNIATNQYQDGVYIRGYAHVLNASNSAILFGNYLGSKIRGCFADVDSTAKFGVGADLYANPGAHAIALERRTSDNVLRVTATDSTAERPIFVASMYAGGTDPTVGWVQFVVGGAPGVAGVDPTLSLCGGGYVPLDPGFYEQHRSTMLVVAPKRAISVRSCAFQTVNRASNVPDNTHLVNFHSDMDFNPGRAFVRLLSVTGYYDANRRIFFEVRGDGTSYSRTFSTFGADVAENFTADALANTYPVGSVMEINSATNKIRGSSSHSNQRVVGVVSTLPGVRLQDATTTPDPLYQVPIATSGTVMVYATTEDVTSEVGGVITVGDMLTSGGLIDGKYTAARMDPNHVEEHPGAIIGKALQPLTQAATDPPTLIKMMVMHR